MSSAHRAFSEGTREVDKKETSPPAQPAGPPVPLAYYRDEPPPLPPPGDPHWREWPEGTATEPLPRWIVGAIIGAIAAVLVIHILFILILLPALPR
jgi:hypothetical protein